MEKPEKINYNPAPIDTSKVTLTAEILKLTEILSKNTHEIWAQQRLADGWQYGPQRDDTRKEHPGLVAYEDLPESEKHYDRIIVLQVLKALLALGYHIEANGTGAENLAVTDDKDLDMVLKVLQDSCGMNLVSLLAIQRQTIGLKPRTSDIYRVLGDQILQLGEPLMAYDVLAIGLKHWPNDVRLQQLLALSLARSGATARANSILLQLLECGHRDEETLGLLARTHKDLWKQATDPEEQNRQLRLAAEGYEQAYQLSGSHYPGINAATMAMLMGNEERAKVLAEEVRQKCLQKLKPQSQRSSDEYWLLATLGEAALILRKWSEAEDWYGQAAQVGQGRYGDLSSTRRNASMLVQYLEGDTGRIKQCFHIPRVVVFSGHMIDQPDRTTLRFPPHLESTVYKAILDRLKKLDARLGYASAACGSDILFLEAILELKGEIHIVLPYDREQFIKDSVDIVPGGKWVERFEKLLDRATETIVASNRKLQETNVLYEYANRLLHGLAKMRAEQLETELVPLAVWNGQPGGPGGTASAIEHWQSWGYDVEVIDLESILQLFVDTQESSFINDESLANNRELTNKECGRQIKALLFADVVHYSHLTEDQIFPFVQHFLGGVAEMSAQSAYGPIAKNTWGDALYFVFSNVRDAGLFALDLCDFVQSTNWTEKGLPEGLNLRIALHAGPVYRHIDPITGKINYIGTHVSHTARIEPITPPGKVYASQAFAAIASCDEVCELTCDYVGQTPWAKGYGTFPTYHVRRRQVDRA
ncbi:TRAFs-binding domain-containing protein [Aerosakkonema sp. BLCC-F183]|uniref:TRAFs-binding domain-containing protein n=1 Tax=Aerosakkonema sp. BLCC-F183 TaxID=3342834 RepID=UPI0035B77144